MNLFLSTTEITVSDEAGSGVENGIGANEGKSASQNVEIKITGVNDTPSLSFDSHGDIDTKTVNELDGGLNTTGTITASDIDIWDTATISVSGLRIEGESAGLQASQEDIAEMLSFTQILH